MRRLRPIGPADRVRPILTCGFEVAGPQGVSRTARVNAGGGPVEGLLAPRSSPAAPQRCRRRAAGDTALPHPSMRDPRAARPARALAPAPTPPDVPRRSLRGCAPYRCECRASSSGLPLLSWTGAALDAWLLPPTLGLEPSGPQASVECLADRTSAPSAPGSSEQGRTPRGQESDRSEEATGVASRIPRWRTGECARGL